jgi:PAS domain S-box-containing protein
MGRANAAPTRKHSTPARGRARPRGPALRPGLDRGFIALYRNAPIGIARLSPAGRFIRANDALLKLLRYTERELRARTFDEVTHAEDVSECRRLFGGLQRGEIDRFEMEKRFVRKDGEVIWARVAVAAVRRGGRLQHTIGFATDLTESKRSETKLQRIMAELEDRVQERTSELARSNEALEVYANVVSHDLNAPLHKISMCAELLQEHAASKLAADELDFLERIHKSAVGMSKLIGDVLTLSRVGQERLPVERVDLNAAAAEVLSDLEVALDRSGGTVEIGPLPAVLAHSSHIRQVLQNLVSNAIKFRAEGRPPKIIIRAEGAPDGGIEISVEDNGIGFEERYAEQIFEPFRRLHAARDYEGSGIGLATCRRIATVYGGRMKAASVPGRGSMFTLWLPRAAVAA